MRGHSTVLGFNEWISVKLHGSVILCSTSTQVQQQGHWTVLSFRHHTPVYGSVQHLQEICWNAFISVTVNSVLVFNTLTGADPGLFFSEGVGPLSDGVTDCWGQQILIANTKKKALFNEGGGGRHPRTLPLDPLLFYKRHDKREMFRYPGMLSLIEQESEWTIFRYFWFENRGGLERSSRP